MDDDKENEKGNKKSAKEYSKQGIFGKYINYGYTINRTTTTNMMSVNNKNTVDTNNETNPDNSLYYHTRTVPNNTNDDNDTTEIKLPNEIEALSGRSFIGDELTTYGDAMGQKKEGMIKISGFNTNSIKLNEIRSTY